MMGGPGRSARAASNADRRIQGRFFRPPTNKTLDVPCGPRDTAAVTQPVQRPRFMEPVRPDAGSWIRVPGRWFARGFGPVEAGSPSTIPSRALRLAVGP